MCGHVWLSGFQIDVDVIGVISDDALKKYLPKFGDRLAVTAFAKTHRVEGTAESACERKRNLTETLKEKMSSHFTRSKKQLGNMNARRQDRRVEVGWVDMLPDGVYKQVYQKCGGGIRHEKFPVDTSMSQILEEAKSWFFPNNTSKRGDKADFDFFMTNSAVERLDGDTTVGELYDSSKVKLLRLYLASTKKVHERSASPHESSEQPTPTKLKKSHKRIPLRLAPPSSASKPEDLASEDQTLEDHEDVLCSGFDTTSGGDLLEQAISESVRILWEIRG